MRTFYCINLRIHSMTEMWRRKKHYTTLAEFEDILQSLQIVWLFGAHMKRLLSSKTAFLWNGILFFSCDKFLQPIQKIFPPFWPSLWPRLKQDALWWILIYYTNKHKKCKKSWIYLVTSRIYVLMTLWMMFQRNQCSELLINCWNLNEHC